MFKPRHLIKKLANDYAKYDGPLEIEACKEGGHDLSYDSDGTQGWAPQNWVKIPGRVKAWAAYSRVLLTGATEFHARVASTSDVATLEVRVDELDGPVLCQIKIPNTGNFQKWTDVTAPISPLEGEHSIYLLFLGEPGPLFGIQHFELTPAAPIAPTTNNPIEVTYALGCTVFTVRIPGWCKNASVLVNHQPLDQELIAGSFIKINRKFRDGDEVVVILPQEIKASDWLFDGIALERGPLVYSLKIDEEWESTVKLIE